MDMLKLALYIMFVTGCFIYFEISPTKMIEETIELFSGGHNTLRNQVKALKHKKKKNDLIDTLSSAKKTLTVNNRGDQFPMYCAISGGGFMLGLLCGFAMHNIFITPVLALGFAITPFIAIRIMSYGYQRQLNEELGTTLSVITSAYVRQEDFVTAVDENIKHIKSPMKEVFQGFLFEVKNVNPNVEQAVDHMRRKIENDTWREWCESVILCQKNKTLRSALTPIVSKFSSIRIVTEDLSYALYDPLKELVVMCMMLMSVPLLMYFSSQDWFDTLMTTIPGQIVIALDALAIFMCLFAGVKHSRPVEYKR